MSKESLWTDAKIANLTFQNAANIDPDARWMHEQIAKDMRNDYERALASRNEDIGRLQVELKQMLTATLTSAQEYEKILLGKNTRITELDGETKELRVQVVLLSEELGKAKAQNVHIADNLERVMRERDVAQAHLTEQEAEVKRLRELVYLAHDTDCTCEICIAMPHEPIICCICNKPIEGDDLDNRFWLHEKDCKLDEYNWCACNLECHAECYAGHEDEYAPLFDDEDDDE